MKIVFNLEPLVSNLKKSVFYNKLNSQKTQINEIYQNKNIVNFVTNDKNEIYISFKNGKI